MRTTILTFLLLLTSGFLGAQQTLTLDLAGARKTALEYNKTVANADLAVQKASKAVWAAIANGLPQLNATADYSNALGAKISIRFAEGMPATEIDIKPTSNFYLNLNQMIFSGNYIVGVQTARLYETLAGFSKEKSELEVTAQVTDAYHLVLISEELLKVMEQNEVNLQGIYDKMSALETFGIIEKNDVDQLWVQVNTLKNVVKSSERQLELARNMLRLVLGVDVDTELILTDKLDSMLDAAGKMALAETFRVENQIDFRMLSQQELVSRKMVDMQKANALPTVVGFYRYTQKLLKPDFDMTPKNMIGLQMNIPLFSSGVRMSQIKQAQVDLEIMRNNKSLLSDQLKIQEKQLRFNYNNAMETYLNQKANVEVSRRVYSSLKLKYEQGIISGLDLINADNNYLRAETDYLSAMMQVLQSEVQLKKLYGNLN